MKSKKSLSKIIDKEFFKTLKLNTKKYLLKLGNFLIDRKTKVFIGVLSIILLFASLIFVINLYYSNKLVPFIKNASDTENLEYRPVALILGAGLNSGEPSQMLQDRLDVGLQLYKQGKVSKLILSGDNRVEDYNEPQAMETYLMKAGVPSYALVPDYAGRRTYDSCYRAKEIFGQTKLYIVTQEFHIVRAVYLCKELGIDTIGITADLRTYPAIWTNILRDYFGMLGAVWDTKVAKPIPVLGDKIAI